MQSYAELQNDATSFADLMKKLWVQKLKLLLSASEGFELRIEEFIGEEVEADEDLGFV